MAKKSLSGDRTVKKKVLKPSTEKVEGNSKSATGQRKAASVSINSLKEQLAQRNDELAIINSVQEGLASKLEMQDIYDLVGNKLREIFNADATSIFSYDRERQSVYGHYYVERDQPVPPLELPFGQGLYTHIIKSRQPLQFGTQQEWLKAGASIVNSPGQDRELNESYLGVPILLGNEVTGVVAIQSYKLNAFGENDVRLLTTLANSMSVALENARLFDETQRLLKITEDRAAELAIINSVQAALAAELNIQGIYDVVGDKIHEIFHNTDMDIRIYDPTTNLLHFPYVYENGKRVTVASIPFQGGGFGQYVLRTRETLVINENVLQEMEKYGSYVLPGTQQLEKSVLFVPLVIGAQARGLITLANTEREHAFSESDVRLLQTLANSMSIALENARLFKAEQERVAELAVINSVQEALASKLDLKAIYDLVGDKIRKPFDADHAYILTFNREQGLIHFEYSIEGEQKDWGWDMPLSEIMLRYFDEGKQPLVINRDMWRESSKYGLYHIKDMLTVFDERGKLREVYEGEPPILYDKDFDIKSVLWAPLIVGNRVGGVVGLENQVHEDAFTESDVRLFQTLTNAVSVAMENARLFDETQRLFKAEQERVAELQIINSIQQGLAAELDFQSIVDLVGDKLCEVFMTNDFAMRWYDEKTNLVHFLYEYEHGERLDIPPGPPTPGGSFEQFLRDRQPIIGNTLDIMARTGGISVPGTDTSKSVVSVPIITSDRVIGSLQIENYERENVYGESELRLLTTIAASLGTALENARLFDEVQKRNLEISEALRQQLATSDVLRAMSSFQPDLRSLLEIIADNVAKVCDANDAHIYRLEGKALKEWTHRGPIPGLEDGESLPLNRGSVIGRAILDRRIIHIHDAQVELNETEYPVSVSLQRRWGYRTVLATPLLRDGEPIGGIAIRRVEVQPFSDKQIELIKTFADQAVIAIENVRLFDETQRLLNDTQQRNAELAIINSVQASLAAKLEMQAIFEAVGDKIQEIFDAQVVMIVTYDKANDLAQFSYAIEKGERFNIDPRPIAGITGYVIRTGKTVMINQDLAQREIEILGKPAIIPVGDDIKSRLDVPMMVGTEVKGVISLQNIDRENAFTESDLRLLTTLANSMSVALENARLFDETQRLLKETEQSNAELASINSVQNGLASKLNTQAIYDLVGDKLSEITGSDIVVIARRNIEEGIRSDVYTLEQGRRLPGTEHPFTPLEKSVIPVLQDGKTIIWNDGMEERVNSLGHRHIVGDTMAPRSVIIVPLKTGKTGENILTTISLQSIAREYAFSASDIRLVETLASSMSVALENARLFDETQRLLKETEQRNAELAIINSVQALLASKLEIQAIYDLVGDKIRDIFNAQHVVASYIPPNSESVHFKYTYGKNGREYPSPTALSPIEHYWLETRQPLVWNSVEQMRALPSKVWDVLTPKGEELPRQKSFVGVAMFTGDEIRGGISLQNLDRENAYNDSDVRLLQTLANSMSVALENARLFDETQRLLKVTEDRAHELSAISTVSQALVAESELDNVIQLIGSQAREMFHADIAYLALLDSQTDLIRFPYQHGENFTVLRLGEGLTSRIIETGEPLLINKDIQDRREQLGTALVGREALSYLGVPIKSGRETIGVLSVQSTTEEGVFDDDDLRLLTTIAANAGAAIHTAQLHAETQRRAREMATLAEVGRDISSSLEASTVLEGIAKHAKELLNGNLSALFIPEGDGTIFRAIAAVGEEAEQVRNDTIKMGEGLLGDLARRRVGEIVNDTNSDPRTILIRGTEEAPDEHLLAVPLLANDELKGLMAVWRTGKSKEFIEAELEFLNNLARQAVIAIQNTQLFKEAKEARAAAEQANKAKSTFLANMSHELRTPLNAIIGFTRIVRKKADGAIPQKQLENLDKVLASSEHLLGLINTVLDIAKIEAGRMDVIAANFSVSMLMDHCANLAMPLLKPRVKLEKDIDPNASIIYSDQDKIKQIVLNLLSNAAKFTHEGKIVLALQRHGDLLNISVTDSGIGISEEALGRIFEEFQQADTSTTRQYGGTGLGLAISRNLARLLGGELKATSELSKGSTFTLTLPIQYGKKPISPSGTNPESVQSINSQTPVDTSKKRILVIDDDPDAAYLLQESLTQNEFTVIGAPDGHAGLQMARDQQPDAILLDILMPETDGWQVLNDLKMDATTVDIPVILLTIVDKKALGFKLGAAAYLLKPLDPTVVVDALRRVIGEKGHPHKQILVVDDDPHVAEMLRQTLPESDFELTCAEDGEAGLQAIETRRPDVILLDLIMPKLDGFGVIERMRATPEWRNIPIIVISAKELTPDESKTLRESVAFVMKKQGFDGDLLKEEINSVVKR